MQDFTPQSSYGQRPLLFADRNFAAEKFLAAGHLIGGLSMIGLAFTIAFKTFFTLMLVHCLLYVPTISITNSIAFANMKDAQKHGKNREFKLSCTSKLSTQLPSKSSTFLCQTSPHHLFHSQRLLLSHLFDFLGSLIRIANGVHNFYRSASADVDIQCAPQVGGPRLPTPRRKCLSRSAGLPRHTPLWPPALIHRCPLHSATTSCACSWHKSSAEHNQCPS